MDTSKGIERINNEGAVEINVETVDYRKSAGREKEPPQQEKVEVTHLIHGDKPGGFVAGAAAKVAEKLQSAKEAVSAETTSNSNSNSNSNSKAQ